MRSGYTCTQTPRGNPRCKMDHSRCTRRINSRLPAPGGCVQWTKWWSMGSASQAMSSNLNSPDSAVLSPALPPPVPFVGSSAARSRGGSAGGASSEPEATMGSGARPDAETGSGRALTPPVSGAPSPPPPLWSPPGAPPPWPPLPVLAASSSVAWPPAVAPSSVDSSSTASLAGSLFTSLIRSAVGGTGDAGTCSDAAPSPVVASSCAASPVVASSCAASCDSATLPSSSSPTL
mmetsp:Transcript_66042/g.183932  ORF Transcript_66042/g.183932 Transcript_66042/m.183932 type:complete len:234 (-) Transcript_66042:783-1484(-)